MSDEVWAELLYDTDTKVFTVVKTSSLKVSGALKWKSEEKQYELDAYLSEFPEHHKKVLELKDIILSEQDV